MRVYIAVLFCIISISYGVRLQSDSYPEFRAQAPSSTCSLGTAIKKFFQGTESNPTVTDSKCVSEYDIMTNRWTWIIQNATSGNFTPTFWIQLAQDGVVAVTATTEWTNFCSFGLLFTRVDNAIESTSGIINTFQSSLLHISTLKQYGQDFINAKNSGDCENMWISVGKIFGIVFQFTITENYI